MTLEEVLVPFGPVPEYCGARRLNNFPRISQKYKLSIALQNEYKFQEPRFSRLLYEAKKEKKRRALRLA